MKKNIGFVMFTMVVIVAMMVNVTAFAAGWDWVQTQQQTQSQFYVNPSFINERGQTCYRVFSNYTMVLEVVARDGNIYNNTSQVLLTTSNSSASNVGIDSDLNVYSIGTDGYVYKYINGFTKETPVAVMNQYGKATSFTKNLQGFVTDIVMEQGNYNLASDSFTYWSQESQYGCPSSGTSYNYNYNYSSSSNSSSSSSGISVVQNSNIYWVTYNNKTFKYTLNDSDLWYSGEVIADDVDEIAFGKGVAFYVNEDNELWAAEIGESDFVKVSDEFWGFTSDSNGIVTKVQTEDGTETVASIRQGVSENSYLSTGMYMSGNTVVVNVNSKKYSYTLTNNVLKYNGTSLGKCYEIALGNDGYLYFVNEDDEVMKVKPGSTKTSEFTDDFREFIYTNESTGIAKGVKTASSREMF
jgi:hypothetical protein